MTYTSKTFNISTLAGISDKQVKVHLGLYEGYVKQVNFISKNLAAVRAGSAELDPYIVSELRRRFAFEFNGARLHEYYFEQFEGGQTSLTTDGALAKAVKEKYGEQSFEAHLREVAGSRGIGWVVAYADPSRKTIVVSFVSDHEIGQLAGLPIILALDLWEHAYMVDYVPADKKNYIDAFFANINWGVVEKRFDTAMAISAA